MNYAKDQEEGNSCGYGMMTLIAVIIIIISATLTFIFANHMYHGTEGYFDETRLKKVEWIPTRTVALPQRRLTVARIAEESEMCFLIPNELEKENAALRVRRSPRESTLSTPIQACGYTVELERNGDFCSEMSPELSRKRRELGCAPVIVKCQGLLGLSDSCLVKDQMDIDLLCETTRMLNLEKC